MSQYLNIYLKKKDEDKPLFLTDYCKSSDVFDAITDNISVPYDSDGKAYVDLATKDLKDIKDKLDDEITQVQSRINLRTKSVKFAASKDAIEELMVEVECLASHIHDLKETYDEVSHLHWLTEIVEEGDDYEWLNFIKLMANIG